MTPASAAPPVCTVAANSWLVSCAVPYGSPQQYTWPARFTTAHAWRPPAASGLMIEASTSTSSGAPGPVDTGTQALLARHVVPAALRVQVDVVVPLPSWPAELSPQQ